MEIVNVVCELEVFDLVDCLRVMGVWIEGDGILIICI